MKPLTGRHIILLISVTFAAIMPESVMSQSEVEYFGSLRGIMHEGDLSAKANLEDFKNTENLYALGAFKDLKGEILVIDGKTYSTRADNGEVIFTEPFKGSAALLVTASVDSWTEKIPIAGTISDSEQLQSAIEKIATEYEIHIEEPFPFLIEGTFEELIWHVIDWPEDDPVHTHEKHQTAGPHGVLTHQKVTILGFYSDSYHGIFTHHASNIHMHFVTEDQSMAGHIDGLKHGTGLTIKLPSN